MGPSSSTFIRTRIPPGFIAVIAVFSIILVAGMSTTLYGMTVPPRQEEIPHHKGFEDPFFGDPNRFWKTVTFADSTAFIISTAANGFASIILNILLLKIDPSNAWGIMAAIIGLIPLVIITVAAQPPSAVVVFCFVSVYWTCYTAEAFFHCCQKAATWLSERTGPKHQVTEQYFPLDGRGPIPHREEADIDSDDEDDTQVGDDESDLESGNQSKRP